jgi:putative membrane protein
MMYWWGEQMNGWGWFVMSVSSVLFLGLVIAAVVVVVRLAAATAADRPPLPPAVTPQSLLADRSARGEIDEAEYRHRADALNETAGNGPTSAV